MAGIKAKPNPAERIAALGQKRTALAVERSHLEGRLNAARAVVAGYDAARQGAAGDERRLEEARRELDQAKVALEDLPSDIATLRVDEAGLEVAAGAVRDSDEGIAFYEAKAAELSRVAEQKQVAAEQACDELHAARNAAEFAWGAITTSRKNRGEEEQAPQRVPHHDVNKPLSSHVGHAYPWPGGLRPEDREVPAAPTRQGKTSLGVREALLQIDGR
jgi:chromosome segregation ATPase